MDPSSPSLGPVDINMDANSQVANPEFVALYAASFQNQLWAVAVAAFVWYDWAVTLSREVRLFWYGRARPLPTALCFSNKYSNLFPPIVALLAMTPASGEKSSCAAIAVVASVTLDLSMIPQAVFTGLRAYALTRNRALSAIVFLISSVQFTRDLVVTILWYPFFGIPPGPCNMTGPAVHLHVIGMLLRSSYTALIVSRVSAVVAETTLFAITLWKLLPHLSINHKARSPTMKLKGLASIMLHDGLAYVVVLLLQNILSLSLTGGAEGVTNFVTKSAGPVSSVLISHFLLDLQEADRRTTSGLATDDSELPEESFCSRAGHQSIGFANARGSLGASIDPAHYGIDREDDGEDVLDDMPDSEAVEGIELGLRAPFPTIADGKRVLNDEITHGGSRAREDPC